LRLSVERGPASGAYHHRLAFGNGENRDEKECEILPGTVFLHVGQEAASVAMLPQIQPIFHGRLYRLGAE